MIRVAVQARPGSRKEAVELMPDGGLAVKVRAPALDGRANAAILQAVASATGLRPAQVRLIRGERSRRKLLQLDLADRGELRRRLAAKSRPEQPS